MDPTATDPATDPSFNVTPFAPDYSYVTLPDVTGPSASTNPANGGAWQTLTNVLQSGVNAYIDGQTAKYLSTTQPGMRVQYGTAGGSHYFTTGARSVGGTLTTESSGNNSLLLIAGVLLVGFFVLRKA